MAKQTKTKQTASPKKAARAKATPPKVEEPASAYERLSIEHQRFVDEYLIDFNATRAYLRCPAYAKSTYDAAKANAHRLLTNDYIRAAVGERQEATRKRLELTKDNILRKLSRMALVEYRDLFRADGSLKHPHEMDADTAAAIQSIEVFEEFEGRGAERTLIGHTKKVKLADQKGSVELAMKHLGLIKEKVEHDVTGGLAALIQKISGTASALPVVKDPQADEG